VLDLDAARLVAGHRQRGEHAPHQAVPIANAAGSVIPLLTVRRRGEAQRRRFPRHDAGHVCPIAAVAAPQTVITEQPQIAGADHGIGRRLGHLVGGTIVFALAIASGRLQQVGDLIAGKAGETEVIAGVLEVAQRFRRPVRRNGCGHSARSPPGCRAGGIRPPDHADPPSPIPIHNVDS
jgi:hypothetical protein